LPGRIGREVELSGVKFCRDFLCNYYLYLPLLQIMQKSGQNFPNFFFGEICNNAKYHVTDHPIKNMRQFGQVDLYYGIHSLNFNDERSVNSIPCFVFMILADKNAKICCAIECGANPSSANNWLVSPCSTN
jgi:hypothetical protein